MNINLEYYRIFYTVAKTGNITLAAKELCISQPAVSQSIKLLEANCGLPLFARTKKGVKLTHAGELLYSYVETGYETILTGEKKIAELMDLETGELWIGASDMTLQFYLLPYLEKYHQLYPNIKVHITNAPTPSTIDHLQAERIDFGLVTGPLPQNPKINMLEIRDVNDIFVAGPKFNFLKGKKHSYDILNEYPTICLESKTSTRHFVDSFLMKNGISLTPEFELATSDMIVQFATRNFGIGSVMADFAKKSIDAGVIFKVDFIEEVPARKMYLISNKDIVLSIAAEKLLQLIKDSSSAPLIETHE